MRIPDHVYELCRSSKTVSSELAKNPTEAPGGVVKRLYGHHESKTSGRTKVSETPATQEELQRAFECGKWGSTRPSDLFLRIYHDVLCSLEDDVMGGLCSPPLLGSSGVIPLSVISTTPDNVRHMSNLIARAEKEVILATNFWAAGPTSTLITNALRELSKRAGERGEKAVVKIIYDRGNPKQFVDNHQIVSPKEYTGKAVQLPAPEEIPNISMQVMNYHRPLLGTFHAKFMVVDRKIAVACSCNIQETDNMEMMCHVEGPIVDSFYDMALITWSKAFDPPLPTANLPAAQGGWRSFETDRHWKSQSTSDTAGPGAYKEEKITPHNVINGERHVQVGNVTLNGHTSETNSASSGRPSDSLNGHSTGIEGTEVSPNPITNASVIPSAGENLHAGSINGDRLPNGNRLPEHRHDDPHYDPDIASEVARIQSVVSPEGSETRMEAVTRHLNTTIQPDTKGTLAECAPHEEMTPYVPHPVHEPFPIAMVNRKPFGSPSPTSTWTPQNAAWLSSLQNAEHNVMIQTPDLNAAVLQPAIIAAVNRGIQVTIYLCLGYNDAGELLPLQGGTNEMVTHSLYTSPDLKAGAKKNLHVFWYVGKDQTRPINNKFKKRSCHIKLMIVDDRIAIQGSGNQDTQSWCHSQEVNILFESEAVVRGWIDGLKRNQNTALYGKVNQEDGTWKDENGEGPGGSIGIDPGRFSWAKGLVGAVQRVRGAGDF